MKLIVGAISTIISVLLVLTMVIPITDNIESVEDLQQWQYDDYRPVADLATATGSLEVTTVGADTFVHARDVGEGEITYTDGTTELITVGKAKLDVFLMYGQSNAAYRNPDPSSAFPVPQIGTAYYFGTPTRAGALATENNTGADISTYDTYDMIDGEGSLRIGDKGPAFAATYYEETHHKVYWVNAAIGGQAIATFVPGAWGWQYAKDVLQSAMSNIDHTKFDVATKDYMWIQGEGNGLTPVNTYKESFLTMHKAILNGDLGYTFHNCYLSKVRAKNAPNPSIAEIELAEEVPTVIMATEIADSFTIENGLIGSDDLHYSQAGNNLIGAALAEAIADNMHITHVGNAENTLIQIIPLLMIIGIVLGVVALFIRNRD